MSLSPECGACLQKVMKLTNKVLKENGFLFFFFPVINEYVGLAVSSEAAWGTVMLLLVPQLLAITWTYHSVSGFRGLDNLSFALRQLKFPTRKRKKKKYTLRSFNTAASMKYIHYEIHSYFRYESCLSILLNN